MSGDFSAASAIVWPPPGQYRARVAAMTTGTGHAPARRASAPGAARAGRLRPPSCRRPVRRPRRSPLGTAAPAGAAGSTTSTTTTRRPRRPPRRPTPRPGSISAGEAQVAALEAQIAQQQAALDAATEAYDRAVVQLDATKAALAATTASLAAAAGQARRGPDRPAQGRRPAPTSAAPRPRRWPGSSPRPPAATRPASLYQHLGIGDLTAEVARVQSGQRELAATQAKLQSEEQSQAAQAAGGQPVRPAGRRGGRPVPGHPGPGEGHAGPGDRPAGRRPGRGRGRGGGQRPPPPSGRQAAAAQASQAAQVASTVSGGSAAATSANDAANQAATAARRAGRRRAAAPRRHPPSGGGVTVSRSGTNAAGLAAVHGAMHYLGRPLPVGRRRARPGSTARG